MLYKEEYFLQMRDYIVGDLMLCSLREPQAEAIYNHLVATKDYNFIPQVVARRYSKSTVKEFITKYNIPVEREECYIKAITKFMAGKFFEIFYTFEDVGQCEIIYNMSFSWGERMNKRKGMKTKIFKSYEDFLKREDKNINGVSIEFAWSHQNYKEDNDSNVGCWNCTNCKECLFLNSCKNCYDCSNCELCYDSVGCYDCLRVVDSSHCRGCTGCFRCIHCWHGVNLWDISYKSFNEEYKVKNNC